MISAWHSISAKKHPLFHEKDYIEQTPATKKTSASTSRQLPLHPNVKRRFPKSIRIGIHGLKELRQHHGRHWISPISKLKELFQNPFIISKMGRRAILLLIRRVIRRMKELVL